jgi:crotonobetainyl-CoA:carnitine CoA-transferase CaiB-like acyl-CoA transferase
VGIPAARLRHVGEALDDPHMAARGLMHRAVLPGRDAPLGVLGPGFAVEGADAAAAAAVPTLGADTNAVLDELGYSGADIARLRADGAL